MEELYELESKKPTGGKMVIYINSFNLFSAVVLFRSRFPDEILVSVRVIPRHELKESEVVDEAYLNRELLKLKKND